MLPQELEHVKNTWMPIGGRKIRNRKLPQPTITTKVATRSVLPNFSPSMHGATTVLNTRVNEPRGASRDSGAIPNEAVSTNASRITNDIPNNHKLCLHT